MAKLKGPLFSLGAAGAIGKTLVYFPWKGLNIAREYVIPANPKTTAQNTQRGYVTAAVAEIHKVLALVSNPWNEADKASWNLLGSTRPTPRTWFNEMVKQWIEQTILAKTPRYAHAGKTTPGADKLDVELYIYDAVYTAGTFKYGTSKTALINSKTATVAGAKSSASITGLTTGVKYFWQFRPTTPIAYVGDNSGIYYGTPT